MTENAHHETPDVAELRRLAEAATPGPWYLDGPWWYGDDDSAYCISTAEDVGRIAVTIAPPRYIFGGEREVRDANARFIAAANPATVLALLDAAAERDALAAKVERVRALHRAVGIYDECDCDTPDPATHLDVDDVGLTCNLMYRVCAECCRDDVYQTEGCASYHAHRLDEDYHCPTIHALDEEPQS